MTNAIVSIREIAHPLDRSIIGKLDNTAIKTLLNGVFTQIVAQEEGLIFSSGIRVTRRNLPDIYEMLVETCRKLNIRVPFCIVSGSIPDGADNAFAIGTDEEPYVAIGNMLPKIMNWDELKFIVSHECGHIAMEHMLYHSISVYLAILAARLSVVGPALMKVIGLGLNYWSRCSEITADRVGLLCCGDLATAQRALLKIEGGFTDISSVDIEDYIANCKAMNGRHFLGRIQEILSSHPLLYKRMEALDAFYNSETYYLAAGEPMPCDRELLTREQLDKKTEKLISVTALGEAMGIPDLGGAETYGGTGDMYPSPTAEHALAIEKEQEYRVILERLMNEYYQEAKDDMIGALTQIKTATRKKDAEGVIEGANAITERLGGKVPFRNMEEFDEYLEDDTVDEF